MRFANASRVAARAVAFLGIACAGGALSLWHGGPLTSAVGLALSVPATLLGLGLMTEAFDRLIPRSHNR